MEKYTIDIYNSDEFSFRDEGTIEIYSDGSLWSKITMDAGYEGPNTKITGVKKSARTVGHMALSSCMIQKQSGVIPEWAEETVDKAKEGELV